MDLLAEGVSQCPTCGTSLAEAGIEHVRSALNSEGAERRRRFDRNKAKITELTAARDSGRSELRKSQTLAEEKRRDLQARVAVLERDVKEGEMASAQLAPLTDELEALTSALADESFGRDVRSSIDELNRKLEILAYDPDAHLRTAKEVQSLQGVDISWLKLQEARARSDETRQDIQISQDRVEELQSRLEGDREHHKEDRRVKHLNSRELFSV